jgi:hypothetical protein
MRSYRRTVCAVVLLLSPQSQHCQVYHLPPHSPHAPRLKQPLYSRSPSLAMAIDYFANPPPGLNLNESRTATNNAVGIILFVLSLVFVALRLFTRLRLKRETIGLDDYLMFLGLALNAGNLACCIAGGYYGLGKHIWTLDAYQMRQITIVFTHPHPMSLRIDTPHPISDEKAKAQLTIPVGGWTDNVCVRLHLRVERVHHQVLHPRAVSPHLWAVVARVVLRRADDGLSRYQPRRAAAVHGAD